MHDRSVMPLLDSLHDRLHEDIELIYFPSVHGDIETRSDNCAKRSSDTYALSIILKW